MTVMVRIDPNAGDAEQIVVRLLRRLGCEVDFPRAQTCCGQPMVNTGYLDEAVGAVRTYVDAFAGYDAVVTPSGSCAGSARHQHAIVGRRAGETGSDPGLASAVAAAAPTYELTEFLVDVLGVTDVGAYFPHTVTYHPTCHSLRMLGVGDRPLRLLREVRGLRLHELPAAEQCCGFGGTFAVGEPEMSAQMGRARLADHAAAGAEVLVSADPSCLLHLGGLIERQARAWPVLHVAEVLAGHAWPRSQEVEGA